MRSRVVQTIVAAVFTGIAGCSVGPDYQRPGISLPDAFVEDGLREDALPLESMWAAFDDDTLTRLIERARTHNADVAIATASLNEARAVAGLQVFSLFPTVTLTAGSERTQQSTLDPFAFPGAGVAQRERAGFDASWEIDLFGTLRRASESIQRRVQARTYSVYATQLRVVAETAQAWFELLGNRNRLAVLQDSLAVQVENLTVLERAYEAGRGTPLDLARARAEERRIAASVPGAAAAVTRSEQRLAVLTGLGVAELRDWVADDQRLPEMPIMQPVGNPAAWLARRPDVAAAEWQLAELTSVIGVRVADLYPRITLLGSLGWTARARADLGSSAAQRWQAVPTLDWRFLDFGRVRQDIREAEAQADGALA
ncbi:MAG: TolC family protein, partial [Pseudomonadota bacterium]